MELGAGIQIFVTSKWNSLHLELYTLSTLLIFTQRWWWLDVGGCVFDIPVLMWTDSFSYPSTCFTTCDLICASADHKITSPSSRFQLPGPVRGRSEEAGQRPESRLCQKGKRRAAAGEESLPLQRDDHLLGAESKINQPQHFTNQHHMNKNLSFLFLIIQQWVT